MAYLVVTKTVNGKKRESRHAHAFKEEGKWVILPEDKSNIKSIGKNNRWVRRDHDDYEDEHKIPIHLSFHRRVL